MTKINILGIEYSSKTISRSTELTKLKVGFCENRPHRDKAKRRRKKKNTVALIIYKKN